MTATAHRLTVEEYLRFVDAAGLDEVELVNGVVYDVFPEGWPHSDATGDLLFVLSEHYPNLKVKNAGSVRLDDHSLVQPDVYVLDVDRHATARAAPATACAARRSPRHYPTADQVLLAVEVAVATRAYDIGPKLAAYARAHVPEYWLVEPYPGGKVLRFIEPAGSTYGKVVPLDLPDGVGSLGAVRAWLGSSR